MQLKTHGIGGKISRREKFVSAAILSQKPREMEQLTGQLTFPVYFQDI
uniref:Uncharacterized protein n=1 Tax=Daphnia magna TaxID=35525 RepID=A0A0P5YFL0_9CRUS